jgi:hypothetical protein
VVECEIETRPRIVFLRKLAKLVFAPLAESTTHATLLRAEAQALPLGAAFDTHPQDRRVFQGERDGF